MSKINKFKNWRVKNPISYKQVKREDLGENIYDHEWYPGDKQQEGTNHDEVMMNNLSEAGTYLVKGNRLIESNQEIYLISDFDGIEEYGLFKGLKLKLEIDETNEKNMPLIRINNKDYRLKTKNVVSTVVDPSIELKTGELEANKIYDLIFSGTDFILITPRIVGNFKGGEGVASAEDVKLLNQKLNYYGENSTEGTAYVRNDGVMEIGHILDFGLQGTDVDFNGRIELNASNGEFYRVRGDNHGDIKKILTEDDYYIDGVNESGLVRVGENGVMESGWAVDFRHIDQNVDLNMRLELGKTDGEFYATKALGNNQFETRKFLYHQDIKDDFNNTAGALSASRGKYLYDNGLVYKRELLKTENLNDVIFTGIYTKGTNENNENLNYPIQGAGILRVERFGRFTIQTFVSAPGDLQVLANETYQRVTSSISTLENYWTEWRRLDNKLYGEGSKEGLSYVRNDGVMELGHILDFHSMNSTNDYDMRIEYDKILKKLFVTKEDGKSTINLVSSINLGATGFVKYDNGLMYQWGTCQSGSSGAATITMPNSFLNQNYQIVGSDTGLGCHSIGLNILNGSQFVAYGKTSGAYITTGISYIAIGRWK